MIQRGDILEQNITQCKGYIKLKKDPDVAPSGVGK